MKISVDAESQCFSFGIWVRLLPKTITYKVSGEKQFLLVSLSLTDSSCPTFVYLC